MWFKVFVLVRFPISAFCLFGCAMLLRFTDALGSLMLLGLLAFLVLVTIRLVQFREGALRLAVWLLLLELVGGVVIIAADNYFGFREFDSRTFALLAGGVGLVLPLPNALVLYPQRTNLKEPAKEKPGLCPASNVCGGATTCHLSDFAPTPRQSKPAALE